VSPTNPRATQPTSTQWRLRDRSLSALVAAPLQRRHWLTLVNMVRTYDQPAAALARYLWNGGRYPWQPGLRTPLGPVTPLLQSYHDLLTVNEVFCRRDYGDAKDCTTVVDIGANVGLAALFFLTRSARTRVWCVEPDPTNVERLRTQLAGFADRVQLVEAAVCPEPESKVQFAPAGRYGHITAEVAPGTITVPAVGIGELLDRVLSEVSVIDLVKIDTEGTEEALVAAVPAGLRSRIRAVVYEGPGGQVRWAWT